jgi:hypothetical protein
MGFLRRLTIAHLFWVIVILGAIPILLGTWELTRSTDAVPTCNGAKMSPGETCHYSERRGFSTSSSDETYEQMRDSQAHRDVPFAIGAIAFGSAITIASGALIITRRRAD